MLCDCIRKFSFDLQQDTCESILFVDRSEWQVGGSSSPSYNLKLTFPDGTTKTFNVVVGLPTRLDLGKCVPPGVYGIEVSNCDTFTANVAITCSLWCGWLKAVTKIGKGIHIEIIRSIRERIEWIESLVTYGDVITAQALTNTVERDLKRINCDCSCF